MTETINSHMTRVPHTIGLEQSIAEADRRMRAFGCRHLPVLKGGALQGIISQRDIALVSALGSVDPEALPVEEVMVQEPLVVSPTAELADVVARMADDRLETAVIIDHQRVVGVFTTTDALHEYAVKLDETRQRERPQRKPSEVRNRLRAEHERLRGLLSDLEACVGSALEGNDEAIQQLPDRARDVFHQFCDHVDLEDSILAPALREADGFGPVREKQLLHHHNQQRSEFHAALASLDERTMTTEELARKLQSIIEDLRNDMAHEDRDLLTAKLLHDDIISVAFGG